MYSLRNGVNIVLRNCDCLGLLGAMDDVSCIAANAATNTNMIGKHGCKCRYRRKYQRKPQGHSLSEDS